MSFTKLETTRGVCNIHGVPIQYAMINQYQTIQYKDTIWSILYSNILSNYCIRL
uniref:Uncharacterized protein n=1 Tax=Solanum lycopersicum TaxID=4081 RepID=A0A3Q7G7J1_SOLLC